MRDAVLDELHAACLRELTKLPGAHNCATSADGLALEAEFTGTHPWTLKIRVDAQRVNLPEVYALNVDRPLAHVSHQRKVCISDEQGVSLDAENYPAVVADAATMALGVLNDAMTGAQAGDHTALFDEFEGYWQGLPNLQVACIALEIDDVPRLVQVSVQNAGKRRRPMAYRDLGPNGRPLPGAVQFLHQRAAYLPLSTALLPPAPGVALDAAFANQYLQALTADGKAVLANLTSAKRDAVFVHLLFSQPRSEGLRAVFGLSLGLKRNRAVPEMPVTPVSLMRCDPAYVRARGGAQASMAAKRVAVLGCGSLGSEIADALASCGVGNLAVVDPDVLTWDNVFRHALGANAVGKYKADALAARLQARYPGVRAWSHRECAEQWLPACTTEFDAFVIAVGHPTRERALNEQLAERGKWHAIVTTWIEALGLGGHVVGFGSDASGCLDCLYSDAEGMAQLRPRTAFVAEGQRVTRNLTGCAGGFTPYSALHSRRTALLATEVVLEYLQGRASATYRFWRGNGRDAAAGNVATTVWFTTAATCSQVDVERAAFSVRCARCKTTV